MKKTSAASPPIYKNPAVPPARRVKDLLSRMTLEEKAAQMMCVWQKKSETLVDANGDFDLKKARAAFKSGHGLGQVGRPSDAGKGKNAHEMAELTNAIQKFFIENSRLGIPVMFHEECLHGHAAIGATSFPQPIGLGATFNPDLVEKLFTMTITSNRRISSGFRKNPAEYDRLVLLISLTIGGMATTPRKRTDANSAR